MFCVPKYDLFLTIKIKEVITRIIGYSSLSIPVKLKQLVVLENVIQPGSIIIIILAECVNAHCGKL